jgi:hypothetical protein
MGIDSQKSIPIPRVYPFSFDRVRRGGGAARQHRQGQRRDA